MARCNSCNKFVSLDTDTEPESNLDADDGGVSGDTRIVNACAECGDEVTEATFYVLVPADALVAENGQTLAQFLDGLTPEGRENAEFEVEETSTERTSRSEGKGRGTRTFYGAKLAFDVKVTVEGQITLERVFSGEFECEIRASGMDTL